MWVVTVHECRGSKALDVYASFGGFTNGKDAEEFADVLYENLTLITKQRGSSYPEWFTQAFEVPEITKIVLPLVTDPTELKKLGHDEPLNDGKVAIDMRKVAQKIIDEEEFEAKTPPPNDDEVAAAIASITGGGS
jgi:hypothetical protein